MLRAESLQKFVQRHQCRVLERHSTSDVNCGGRGPICTPGTKTRASFSRRVPWASGRYTSMYLKLLHLLFFSMCIVLPGFLLKRKVC